MKKKDEISEIDKNSWNEYIKNPKDIFDKDLNSKNLENFEKPLSYIFDLHGYSLEEANKKVKKLITDCYNNNYSEILLITGKGIHSNTDKDVYVSKNLSKLKYSIPNFINTDQELSNIVVSVSNASAKDGGGGALVVKLKNL